MGSSVYLIFFFINRLSLPPVACPDNPNLAGSVRESHCQYFAAGSAETEETPFCPAMLEIFGDDTLAIREGLLSGCE